MILPILAGILLGTITGLIPGIHINLIATLALTLSPFLLTYLQPLTLATIITAMAITHTFLDFIPSTYLGAPDPDTALSILPAHNYLIKGQAYTAIKLATIGSLTGLFSAILITPLLLIFSEQIYNILKPIIPIILIISLALLLLREQNKLPTLIVLTLGATIGIITLNLKNIDNPLFPLLSGLFGTSTLLLSLKDKTKIPKQKITNTINIKLKQLLKTLTTTTIISSIASILPGIASSQTAIIAQSLNKKQSQKYFIILVGSINTIIMLLSFTALTTINKARNGAVITISKIIPNINLPYFITVAVITAAISTILALKISKIFSKTITKINYQTLCTLIIITITITTILLSKLIGLLILITATAIGLLPPLLNTGRNHLMACLIIPIILYFTL